MSLPFAQMSFPEMYEHELAGPLFEPWVEPILEEVDLGTGEHVLDVACGTGIVARLARQRVGDTGRVVGIDLSTAMLAVARRVGPDIDWREGDAGDLPIRADERFDVVVCQQGFQFFPDMLGAARQMHRALKTRGRLAASTWRPDEEFPLLRDLRRVAERRLGSIADRRHSLGNTAALEASLRDAGFRDVRSKTMTRTIRFKDGSAFVRLNAMALVGMSSAAKEMSEDERGRTVTTLSQESAEAILPFTDARGLAFELGTNVVTATV